MPFATTATASMNNGMPVTSLNNLDNKVALITGAARRIGAEIVRQLHASGARVVIHYRSSSTEADALARSLNEQRPDSARTLAGDLLDIPAIAGLVDEAAGWQGRLDILINNASSFYPTPVGTISEDNWHELVGSNFKAPLFLSQAAAPYLAKHEGSIVNIVDIHSLRPLREHVVYGSAKAALAMTTRSLAKDLAPDVRVNGVSPGAILWPEDGMTESAQSAILEQIPLRRTGQPTDIAGCVLYLVRDASYVTGQVIAVDGGRSLGW